MAERLDDEALWIVYDRYSMPNDVQEDRGLSFDTFLSEVAACVRSAGNIITLAPDEISLIVATLHVHAIEYTPEKGARMEALARRLAEGYKP
jgi:hypothetical protein